MRVRDIFLEVKNLIGLGDEATIFSRLSDAVECLANKGLIDAMQGYLEIPTTSSRIVTLPRDVEVPVKVNVGDNPSFGRTKLYEFTMNGPGSNYTPTDWGWEDRGTVPTIAPISLPSELRVSSGSAVDNGKKLFIYGRDAENNPISATMVLNFDDSPQTPIQSQFASVDRVSKDVTQYSVTLTAVIGNALVELSTYAPDETEPRYRQIRLSQSGTSAHILFRRSVYRVSSQDDWIPIQSRMGLFLMIRANELYRKSVAADIQTAQALEKQAEQFVSEEQKSRNIFAEVASQTEKDSARGLYFTNRDSIIVADIYDEAADICGPIGQSRIFDRITESIEALANKAQWDAMTAYLDIIVGSGNVIALPREVEVPIKININGSPSFSRDRLYEFTLNGPGSNMQESTDFSWMDAGNVPITGTLSVPSLLHSSGSSPSDDGRLITVYGKDTNDRDVSEQIAIEHTIGDTPLGTVIFKTITRVVKPVTVGGVQILTAADGILGYYYPDEIEPSYRRIVLSKTAPAVRIMFRKASMRVTSMSDLIPLQSRAAITCMMRSFELYRNKDTMPAAKAAEDKAVALLQDEQTSRNVFSKLSEKELQPIIGLNINNRDSIIVADIYDDTSEMFGLIGRNAIFDKITTGLEILDHKGQWDGNEGYVDITSVGGIVTLPRYVDYVMAINLGRRPTQLRNRWFEFHLNGPGSQCSQSCGTWTNLERTITLSDLTEAQAVIYRTDSATDDGKTITIYGYDENDQWIRENGADGFTVVGSSDAEFNVDAPSPKKVKRIERITRDATTSFAQLIAYDATGAIATQLGYYYPDETEPNYARMQLPCSTCWVRMRYRKRSLKVTSLTDPIHLRSRLAIMAALGSIKALMSTKPDIATSTALEAKAVQLLTEEKVNRTPGDSSYLQFSSTSMAPREQGYY